MKRLAVFDIDGTLVDSRRSIGDAMRDAWLTLGLAPPSYDETRQVIGLSLDAAMQTLGPTLSAEQHDGLAQAYKDAFLRNRAAGYIEPLYDGAREAVAALRDDGWLLGVATGKSRKGVEHILEEHGMSDWFAASFCADDGPGKPDPHMLECNMRALDMRPEQTVMIGDTGIDMAMARAANCYALGVVWGFHTHDEVAAGGAHEVARDFDELSAALRRWRVRELVNS